VCTRQDLGRQPGIPQYVTVALSACQVCLGVGRCDENVSCSSSSLKWKSSDSMAGISYCFNKC